MNKIKIPNLSFKKMDEKIHSRIRIKKIKRRSVRKQREKSEKKGKKVARVQAHTLTDVMRIPTGRSDTIADWSCILILFIQGVLYFSTQHEINCHFEEFSNLTLEICQLSHIITKMFLIKVNLWILIKISLHIFYFSQFFLIKLRFMIKNSLTWEKKNFSTRLLFASLRRPWNLHHVTSELRNVQKKLFRKAYIVRDYINTQ